MPRICNYFDVNKQIFIYSMSMDTIRYEMLHSVEKTLIQKTYCVYYYILKKRRFFMSINSVVDFSLNFK